MQRQVTVRLRHARPTAALAFLAQDRMHSHDGITMLNAIARACYFHLSSPLQNVKFTEYKRYLTPTMLPYNRVTAMSLITQ